MGFLSEASEKDTGTEAAPQKPSYGGFLSDNPPPQEKPVERVPDWSEIPQQALANAPESAWNFLKNTAQTFMHPIDTAQNVGRVISGYGEKADRALGLPNAGFGNEKYADAVNQLVMERYGSMDNFKKTLASDPVGVASDLSMVLGGLGALPGKVGKIAATASTLTDPFTAIRAPAALAGKSAALGAGYMTGAGMRNVEEAARAGVEGGDAARVFRENQLGEVPGENLVRNAQAAEKKILEAGSDAYRQGRASLNTARQVPWTDIDNFVRQSHNTAAFVGPTTGIRRDLLTERGRAMRSKLDQIISDYKALPPQDFQTVGGFDALKREIGHHMEDWDKGSPEHKVASQYYSAVKNAIIDAEPKYRDVMRAYQDMHDQVNQISRSLGLPRDERKLNVDSALRKLSSIMRRNVNTNYGQRERLVDVLDRAMPDAKLKSAIAGQALSSPEAHGLARLIPALGMLDFKAVKEALLLGLASPQKVGTIAYRAGQIARPIAPFYRKPVPELAQQAGRWMPNVEIRPVQEARGGRIKRAEGGAVGNDYNTPLTPTQENKFQAWKSSVAPRDSGYDYDFRGAYLAGLKPSPESGHWPDTFKKPNHDTFSEESKYATGENRRRAGFWTGDDHDVYVPPSPMRRGGSVDRALRIAKKR